MSQHSLFGKDLAYSCYQVVIVSTKILNNESHFKELWGKRKFTNYLINLVLDEAHIVKEWGQCGLPPYWSHPLSSNMKTNNQSSPQHIYHTFDLLLKIKVNLHLCTDATKTFHHSTDHSNIFLVVHQMEHNLGSYHDLMFVIKLNLTVADPCPSKFLISFNSCREAQEGTKCLWKRLSPELCHKRKWHHSGMTGEYQDVEMHALQIGNDVFGDADTDAAGMVLHFHFGLAIHLC